MDEPFTKDDSYVSFCSGELAEPYGLYHRLRAQDPVHWSEVARCWILTRYDDVERVLQFDRRLTANRLTVLLSRVPKQLQSQLRPLAEHLAGMVQYHDPPHHTRLRSTAGRTFTPRLVESLRPQIQSTIDQLLRDLQGREHADLIADFANPLPAIVIADIVGVPPADRQLFRGWADEITRFMEGIDRDAAAVAPRTNEAIEQMADYLADLVQSRRLKPVPDLLTHLTSEHDRGNLERAELFAWCMFLLDAGHETTTGLIGNGLLALMRNPGQLTWLCSHPDGLALAVEELLRYDSPVQRISRVVVEEFVLGGKTLRGGDWVWAMIGAANRDPERFLHPDRLDLQRSPNRHIAFGYGVHFCLGASLARLEGQLALRTIVKAFPKLRLVDKPERWRGISLHRLTKLPVRLN